MDAEYPHPDHALLQFGRSDKRGGCMCAAVQGYLGPKYRMAANAHYKSKKFLKKLIRTTYRNRGRHSTSTTVCTKEFK